MNGPATLARLRAPSTLAPAPGSLDARPAPGTLDGGVMRKFWNWSCVSAMTLATLPCGAQEFSVRRASDDSEIFSGTLSDEHTDSATKASVRFADFSAVDEPGDYYLDVPGVGRSVAFRIGPDVYDGELAAVMLGFYGWRSGVDLSFEYHGTSFGHSAGHLDDALLDYVDDQVGVRRDGAGGWYDAGDYGKYLPTAAESVNTMLAAWELFGDNLEHLELPFIVDQNDALPDFLDELKFELDWLLKMAYADGSGRVHHKINSPRFPGFVLPADDPTTRYFSNYSTAATAEFVATMAKAARAFAPYDDATDGYSEKLLEAARLAYDFLREHPENVRYDNSVLAAGEYQKDDTDDRIWAAAELWETTGDADVLADFEERVANIRRFVPNFDWDTTTNFGLVTYVLSKREGRDPEIVARLEEALQTASELIAFNHGLSGYGRALNVFYWGTNGVIARTCLLLHAANALEPNPQYLDICADQIGYLYGRNQYGRSQVTGAGIEPPLFPHHRPSGADDVELPYPGLLVGGGQRPNDWRDEESSFSTNEVAINWNAALVFALAGFIQGEGASASLGRGPVAPEDCGVRVNSAGYVPDRSKVATVQVDCELPDTFECTAGDATLSGDQSGPPSLIDDLDDGDDQILGAEGRQGRWFVFDDGSGGTRTDLEIGPSEGSDGNAVCISGSGFELWGGGVGFPLSEMGSTRGAYDANAYTGLTFKARGSATRFRVMMVDEFSDPAGNRCSGCNDHFQYSFEPSADWQTYSFTWGDLAQLGFGDQQPRVCAAGLSAIQFQWLRDTEFELCLDDIAFTTPAGATPAPSDTPPATLRAAGGGCGCRTAEAPNGPYAASPLLLLGLLAWRRPRGG